ADLTIAPQAKVTTDHRSPRWTTMAMMENHALVVVATIRRRTCPWRRTQRRRWDRRGRGVPRRRAGIPWRWRGISMGGLCRCRPPLPLLLRRRRCDDDDDDDDDGNGNGNNCEREEPSTDCSDKRRSASPLPSSPSPPALSPIATRAFPASTLTGAAPELEERDQQQQLAVEITAEAAAAAAAAKVNPAGATPGENVAGRAARRAGGCGDGGGGGGGGGGCGVGRSGPISSRRSGEVSTRPAENVVKVTPVAVADVPTREPPFGMIILTKLRNDDPRLVRSAEKCRAVVREGGSGGSGGQDGSGPARGTGNDPAGPASGRPDLGGPVRGADAMEEESVADRRNEMWGG
ncbi:unnamed protein product, partial [Sphacelaria rigidula]